MPAPFQFKIVKTPVVNALVVKGPTGATGPAGPPGGSGVLDYLSLNDSGLAEEMRIASQDGRLEYFPASGGSVKEIAVLNDLANYVQTSVMQAALSEKQDTLVSGTNIKTINGNALPGSGNIVITGGSGDALVANPLSQFASTTSAQLRGVISDETGSGSLVFATSPTLVTPVLGVATGTRIVIGGITDGGSSGKYYGYGLVTDWITYDRASISTSSSLYLDLDAAGALWLRSGRDNAAAARVMSNGGLVVRNRADNADAPLTAGTTTIGGGTAITKVLSATATLDFGSVAANAYADLTITVTGAAIGNVVSLGVPNGSLTNDISFFGWVSATNTVTVRCSNVSSTTARDPASGTFRVQVTQF